MQQPHIVILESRRFPDITEQWYSIAVSALSQQGIGVSRVTVPTSADLTIALRMLLDAGHQSENNNLLPPDGYLTLGLNYKGDISEQNHNCIWQLLQDLATKTGIPYASVLEFEHNSSDLNIAATSYTSKVQLAVQSLVNLMMLRHQLHNPPFSTVA